MCVCVCVCEMADTARPNSVMVSFNIFQSLLSFSFMRGEAWRGNKRESEKERENNELMGSGATFRQRDLDSKEDDDTETETQRDRNMYCTHRVRWR